MISQHRPALHLAPAPVETRHSDPLLGHYQQVRRRTEQLVAPLSPEDMVVQSMPDASPAKWHLAHCTWFFETFLLSEYLPDYRAFDPTFCYLFNSYYEAVGPRHPRPQRGLMTRPALDQVIAYRQYVDLHMHSLLGQDLGQAAREMVELGLAHEQQHQELLLMDIHHLFNLSSLKPVYDSQWPRDPAGRRGRFKAQAGGLLEIGHNGQGFSFDNEGPRHQTFMQPYEISDRLVTNGQWLEFIDASGYEQVNLWLSDGWATVQAQGWKAPLYWQATPEGWHEMTLRGLQPLDPNAPVTHISYYEAAAFAQWAGARLPTEAEWETAAAAGQLEQVDDAAWQWTQSAYSAYPGFQPAASAVGEYNGKFMVSQMVLRGGASITAPDHCRLTYRNFFGPGLRWMCSGLRLARDARPGGVKAPATKPEEQSEFARDVIEGLSAEHKHLSPKYFYDATGSRLFEDICTTAEYYPTRAETTLLQRIAPELAALIPADAALVEFGSGASDKTRLLLDAAPQTALYVPIDICRNALDKAALQLRSRYPRLNVAPLVDDFTRALHLPSAAKGLPRVGFFPGSTLGNFTRPQAVEFLRSARTLLGRNAVFIIGVDMVKDPETLVAAYNDASGVTAAFNKNLLTRLNRELHGDFDLDAYDHLACWNPEHERMEMHLVSQRAQQVNVAGQRFSFAAGERLHTENSHKFTEQSFTELATLAGWRVSHQWLSEAPQVGMFCLF
ncbi:ergothioneine biosynthesis protein EgtB [Pseudomonas sp. dw_358]|uniref:ergothioneine biosynthesis protein EgtB n=1 Tax=Pseudomonas sp. dw_358 TaxID=2720083 RepID=UPI001BD5E543|nr:ergothioneine biosynthesis protein EgtB [Pseudomonas sp. dw_358]